MNNGSVINEAPPYFVHHILIGGWVSVSAIFSYLTGHNAPISLP